MNMRLGILMVILILHLQNTLLLNTVTYIHAHTHTYAPTHTHTHAHTPPPPPPPPTHADFQYSERFVYSAYDIQCRFNTNDINKLRYLLCNLRRLPPTRDTLRQHIFNQQHKLHGIWGKTLKHDIQVPSPTEWGWRLNNDRQLVPTWCPFVLVELKDFVFTCCCKGTCTRCKCMIKGTSCLPFCNCNCKKGK